MGDTYTVVSASNFAIRVTSSMSDTPKYGFHRHPQFSVNHMAEYLATTYATQRTKLICAAKFPKKVEVTSYAQIRNRLRAALTKPKFDRDGLDFLADKLDGKARTETGYNRDEALRCGRAVRAFQDTFNPKTFNRYTLSSSSRALALSVSSVKINVSLDATVTETKGDVTSAGGIVLLYAFSADRGDVGGRLSAASSLILWALEGGQMPPLPRLCMAVDLAEKSIVKASDSFQRFRERVTDSCSEAAARWDAIEPPADYDGPDWR